MKNFVLYLLLALTAFLVFRNASPTRSHSAEHPLIQHAVDADFRDTVSQAGDWVLVDLWAPWCGPCQRLKPLLNEIAPVYHPRLTILAVNVDEASATSDFFGVRSIPCLVLLHKGKEVDRIVGLPQLGDLKSWIDGKLAATPGA
jgi:thioredoxin